MFFTDRELLDELMLDAKQYSLYAGTYLEFVHTRSRNNPPEHNLIYVGPENFMHLVGIESDTCTAIDFYKKCLEGSVRIEDCTPVHDKHNREQKTMLFPLLFDFSRAKFYKFGNKDLSTYWDDFEFATGNDAGTIGYDLRNPASDYPVPVTLINQPISRYCSEIHRILAVVQLFGSPFGEKTLLFEIKEGIYDSLLTTSK